jgi:hypothetical protein
LVVSPSSRFKQDAEKVRQHRSRLIEILNVARGYASGFESPAALRDSLFEHPADSSGTIPLHNFATGHREKS